MATTKHTPTRGQMQALNDAMKGMGITRVGRTDDVDQIAHALAPEEFPEMALMVEYQSHTECLAIATDRQLLLLKPKLFSKKRDIKRFPYHQLTDVSWKPGIANHRITLHLGKRQEVIHCSWLAGQDRGRDLVALLRSGIPEDTKAVAATPQSAKARTLEEWVYHLDPATKSGITGKLDYQQLARALDAEEMPVRMVSGAYDFRAEYSYRAKLEANADLKSGTLMATPNRLVFVHKPTFGQPLVIAISYNRIEDVTHTTGKIFGSLSIWVDGAEQKFDKIDQAKVAGWVHHVQQRAGISPVPVDAPANTLDGYLRQLDMQERELLLQSMVPQDIADLLGDGEVVERIRSVAYTDNYMLEVHAWPGVLVRTDRRLLYCSNWRGSKPAIASFKYDDIDSIDHTRGRLMGSITIVTAEATAKFDQLPDGEVAEWLELIQERAGIGA